MRRSNALYLFYQLQNILLLINLQDCLLRCVLSFGFGCEEILRSLLE